MLSAPWIVTWFVPLNSKFKRLSNSQAYQQPLNITVRENEECYFRNIGSQTIYLTGNFVVSPEEIASDDQSDDEMDEDDLLALNNLGEYSDDEDLEDNSEEDVLDALENPRLVELGEESEDEEKAPQLVKAKPGKNKNKRAAEDDAEEALEGILKKSADEKPHSKKLKNNAGHAVSGVETNGNAKSSKDAKAEERKEPKKGKKEKESKKEETTPQSNGKKVQFAEKLEQGPTPSKTVPTKGPRVVEGVSIDDKKHGSGPAAKKGDKVGMRYIGKLKDGKVFDGQLRLYYCCST
jgi:FK506-binding nuclear protein